MKRLGIILVLAAVGVGLKFARQGDDSKQVLSEMKEVFAEADFYQSDPEFMNDLLERHHLTAFNEAYDIGSRRRRATFDEDKYLDVLLTGMISECNQRDKREAAGALIAFKAAVQAEE